jgi:tyrosyl-tRNA synthetase
MTTTVSTPPAPSKALPLTDSVQEALAITKRGVDELLIESEFAQKLARSEQSGKPLRIKLGLDPTAPDLHLGHTVVLNKMRQLQDLGHQVIFLIGDFTSMIGDPSGRNVTRPPLTREQIEQNAHDLFQAGLAGARPGRTEIRYNSEWCDPLGARGMIQLASRYTVARMMERDDFTKRYKSGTPIAVHEFLYPLMQGYDSVALKADLELGGTDQKFNLLVGRELQKDYGQEPQCILTMPLLEGLDGVDKMSKSKNNYIGITEPANTMFAKLMSISDVMMWKYYELLSFRSIADLAALKADRRRRRQSARRQGGAGAGNRRALPLAGGRGCAGRLRQPLQGRHPGRRAGSHAAGAPLGMAQLLKAAGLCASVSEAGA